MQVEASVAGTGSSYQSLMARLSALQGGNGQTPLETAIGSDAGELAAAYRKRVVWTYFGCGLVTSLALGCAALLPLLYAHPGAPRNQGILAMADATATSGGESLAFELPIRHSDRADAPFPLQITGVGPADVVSVVVRDVPEATWLSSGERRDEHTWVLQPADLGNLRLSLREGTPEAFDMTIEVASASGEAAARSVARVRLLDTSAQAHASATTTVLAGKPLVRTANAKPALQRVPEAPVRARASATQQQQTTVAKSSTLQQPKIVTVQEPAVQQLPTATLRPTRPEGMSALGALPHDDPQGRQLWWRMPTPTWAPFPDIPGRN